ncbi:IAA-amino acid hydrolase ILR1-like protein [Tanacetum coccineum]
MFTLDAASGAFSLFAFFVTVVTMGVALAIAFILMRVIPSVGSHGWRQLVDTKVRLGLVVETQAAVHQCEAELDFMDQTGRLGYPVTDNDEGMYEHAKTVAEIVLGKPNVQLLTPLMASEDFSFFTQRVPSAMFFIGIKNTTHVAHNLHSPYFIIDEEVLPLGAALHAAVAISYLDSHGGGGANRDEL